MRCPLLWPRGTAPSSRAQSASWNILWGVLPIFICNEAGSFSPTCSSYGRSNRLFLGEDAKPDASAPL